MDIGCVEVKTGTGFFIKFLNSEYVRFTLRFSGMSKIIVVGVIESRKQTALQ